MHIEQRHCFQWFSLRLGKRFVDFMQQCGQGRQSNKTAAREREMKMLRLRTRGRIARRRSEPAIRGTATLLQRSAMFGVSKRLCRLRETEDRGVHLSYEGLLIHKSHAHQVPGNGVLQLEVAFADFNQGDVDLRGNSRRRRNSIWLLPVLKTSRCCQSFNQSVCKKNRCP